MPATLRELSRDADSGLVMWVYAAIAWTVIVLFGLALLRVGAMADERRLREEESLDRRMLAG